MKLSVIIPCKNEEGNVKTLHSKLSETLKTIDYELIFVDDGSTDQTLEELKAVYNEDKKHMRIVSFSRNFKKEAAMYAGLLKSSGEYTCIIDGDLQQNPHYLIEMLEFLNSNPNYDQVAMIMKKRNYKNESAFHKFCKKCFYKIIDLISDVKFVSGASDFRMFRSNVRSAILQISESNRFSKGIFAWIGFNTHYMNYEVENRIKGVTKFNFGENVKFAFDGIIAFSTKPLRIATFTGIFTSISAFLYLIYIVIKTLYLGIDVPGYSSLMCIILLLGGIQLITIGILGEYLAKAYIETKKRPIYISREEIGFKK